MKTSRAMIFGVAALAAGVLALLVRGLLGGGTPPAKAALPPPPPQTAQILVAAEDLQPGTAITENAVRWQKWPKSAIDSSFVVQSTSPDFKRFISGAVVRAPMVAGEPLTASKIVHTDSVGFMSAIVKRGMRAVSVGISTESGAGGFILPSDRVDVIVTQQASDSSHHYSARTVLKGVRVLAVDQTYEDRDQKVVLAKTATLELTPHQAELLEGEHAAGTISLSLRSLGDDGIHTTASANNGNAEADDSGPVTIIRFGNASVATGQEE
jgi:pilus assembly protein CpaB